MKVCAKCKIEKQLDQFGKNSKCKDGIQRICKSCINIAQSPNPKPREHYAKPNSAVDNGDPDSLNLNVVNSLVQDLTRSYRGKIESCDPTVVCRVSYPKLPKIMDIKSDIRSFAGVLDYLDKLNSNINLLAINVNVEGDVIAEYEYRYGINIQSSDHKRYSKEQIKAIQDNL